MPPQTVLLVGPDAEAWAEQVYADATAAADLDAARAYLGGTVFDAVWVQGGLPVDGLRALRDALGLSTPVEPVGSLAELQDRLDRRAGPSEGAVQSALAELRDEMGRVAHALNNPLSVIAGNAQLGLEVGAALGVDADVTRAFAEIQVAAAELGDLFDEVAALRARIDRLLA